VTGTERVVVWPEPDGYWRWRYVGEDPDGEEVELLSTVPTASREEAVASAEAAYPGLPVQVDGPEDPAEPAAPGARGRRHGRPARRWPVLAVLVAGVSAARHRWRVAGTAALLAGLLAARNARGRRHRR
jgi:hypothetical protein